jgi:putative ABC transport system permease protein
MAASEIGEWRLAARLARRELRGGLKGFRIFLACLLLGVAVIAAVGSTAAAVRSSILADAQKILGGDVELRLLYRPATDEQLAFMSERATVSHTREMRAMARPGARDDRALVELKAIDGLYPLYGGVTLEPSMSLAAATEERNGRWGAAADPNLIERLGLKIGDAVKVGDAVYELRAAITREPDRGSGIFILGPRLMVADGSLDSTGLVQPGSLIYHLYRVKLPRDLGAGKWLAALKQRFPDGVWRIRELEDAAAGTRNFIERTGLYLILVGLAALLVGGVGVGNAVRSYLQGKTPTLATLKCLGAPARLVFRAYLLLILVLAAIGIVAGLILGALTPPAITGFLSQRMALDVQSQIFPLPLALAAAFGLLTAIAFSLAPLFRAARVPGGQLFRDLLDRMPRRPSARETISIAIVGLLLAGLVVVAANDRALALGFIVGAILCIGLFQGVAWAIKWAARRASARPQRFSPTWRLALTNLHRPGAPTSSIVLSLGLGMTVLVAVAAVERNLRDEVRETMPATAPSFFFIDIQADQTADFDSVVGAYPGVSDLQRVPMLRGRITAFNDVPADKVQGGADMRWVLEGDRGITWSATIPPGSRITQGEWWPADYRGPPLISLDAEVAQAFGLKVGDTITVNVLGRKFTGSIANFREFEWSSLTINFVMVFSPGILEGAPQTHIATARIPTDSETGLQKAVSDRFPNVSSIRVKEALETVNQILSSVADAVRICAAVTLLAGVLVLGGAVVAGHHRRVYDAVVLKVVGARRSQILSAYLIEYGLLGLATAVLAAILGAVISYLFITRVMEGDWRFVPLTIGLTALVGVALTLLIGLGGTWRALGQRPAQHLRNE